MNTENFDPADSLKTIEKALSQAKSEKTGASYYYQLWGSVLFAHFLLQYIIIRFPNLQGNLPEILIWAVFPLGGLFSYLKTKNDTESEKSLSLFEKVYLFAFGGLALAYITVFIASAFTEPRLHIAFFSVLLGFTVFVVGGITRHRTSVVGGILGIVCGGISMIAPLQIQFLMAALSALTCCIIPGYLMKNAHV